jgi:hypothetical protein
MISGSVAQAKFVSGEIFLASPFGDAPGMKLRPVLLLTGAIGAVPEVLVAYISSVVPADPFPSDIVVNPRGRPIFQARISRWPPSFASNVV